MPRKARLFAIEFRFCGPWMFEVPGEHPTSMDKKRSEVTQEN